MLTTLTVVLQQARGEGSGFAVPVSADDGVTTWHRSATISVSEQDCWKDCVRDIAVSHDGTRFAVHAGVSEWGDDTNEITIWDVETKKKLSTVQRDDISTSSIMALSSYGNWLAYSTSPMNGLSKVVIIKLDPDDGAKVGTPQVLNACSDQPPDQKAVIDIVFPPSTDMRIMSGWGINTTESLLLTTCGEDDDRESTTLMRNSDGNEWAVDRTYPYYTDMLTFSTSGNTFAEFENTDYLLQINGVIVQDSGAEIGNSWMRRWYLLEHLEFTYTTSSHGMIALSLSDVPPVRIGEDTEFEMRIVTEPAVLKVSAEVVWNEEEERYLWREPVMKWICVFPTSHSDGETMSSNIEIESMKFTPNGDQLIRVAEIGYQNTVTVFDLTSGSSVCPESQILSWSDNDVDHIEFVRSGDTTLLIAASEDDEDIMIWSDQWSPVSTARSAWLWISQHGEVFFIVAIIALYVFAAIAQGSKKRSEQKWAQAREALPRITKELGKIEEETSSEALDVEVLRPCSISLQTILGELATIRFPKDMKQSASELYSRAAMVQATVDRKLWMGAHGLAEERLQRARELSNQGARAHEGREYQEAYDRFSEAMQVAQSVSDDPVMSEHKELAELATSIYERSRDNRAEAQRGIISVDLTSRLEQAPSRLAALFESVEDRPIDAKRDARKIEAELEEAIDLAKTHEFPEIAAAAMPHIAEARRLIARADEVSMSGITSVTSVTSSVKVPTGSRAKVAPQEETSLSGWERLEKIASGGMATVHMAKNVSGKDAIWKQAHGKHNPLASANMKITDEAALLQEIRHPRIPEHFDHGVVEGKRGEDVSVLIMEHIEGGDLKNTVEQVRKVGAQISTAKAIEYLTHACEPLEALASRSEPIYHRDLKPHNVIIHPQRGPIIIDWGLAKQVATGSDVSVTRGGSGTWTPPERDAGVSGPFTDVYSLGKILYFLLTKDTPPAILAQEKVASRLTELERPAWLAQFIVWACWPQHEKRIQSIHQFRILMQNDGVWPEGQPTESSASDSGDFTTWG